MRMVGETTFALCRDYLDGCITVGIDEICASIKDVFEDTRAILEPAGALAVAGLKRMAAGRSVPSGSAVAIASGANVDFDRLALIAARTARGSDASLSSGSSIPDRTGDAESW